MASGAVICYASKKWFASLSRRYTQSNQRVLGLTSRSKSPHPASSLHLLIQDIRHTHCEASLECSSFKKAFTYSLPQCSLEFTLLLVHSISHFAYVLLRILCQLSLDPWPHSHSKQDPVTSPASATPKVPAASLRVLFLFSFRSYSPGL